MYPTGMIRLPSAGVSCASALVASCPCPYVCRESPVDRPLRRSGCGDLAASAWFQARRRSMSSASIADAAMRSRSSAPDCVRSPSRDCFGDPVSHRSGDTWARSAASSSRRVRRSPGPCGFGPSWSVPHEAAGVVVDLDDEVAVRPVCPSSSSIPFRRNRRDDQPRLRRRLLTRVMIDQTAPPRTRRGLHGRRLCGPHACADMGGWRSTDRRVGWGIGCG